MGDRDDTLRSEGRVLLDTAAARGIPAVHLGDVHFRFGEGCHHRRLYRTYTDRTSHLAWVTARDKTHTARALRGAGLPVPAHRIVATSEAAVAAAEALGYPVVVKPRSADWGVGVTVGIAGAAEVATAFELAAGHEEGVLVEEHIDGDDYRLLVVDGELVAAARREAAHVVGDGSRSITDLIAVVNTDLRRGVDKEKPLVRLVVDDDMLHRLADAGLTPDSVPVEGETVFLRGANNISLGGTATDVTDEVHPDNRELAVRAAAAIGLDIAGVDFLSPDISRSYRDAGGSICEVNPTPGLRMHLFPSEGTARDVTGAILDLLFPRGAACHIPIAALASSDGSSGTVPLIREAMDPALTVAVVCGRDVAVGEDTTEFDSARSAVDAVLSNGGVEGAIVVLSAGEVVEQGLPLDRCDVALIPASLDIEPGSRPERVVPPTGKAALQLSALATETVVLPDLIPEGSRGAAVEQIREAFRIAQEKRPRA